MTSDVGGTARPPLAQPRGRDVAAALPQQVELADLVVERVLGVRGVVRMHTGTFGEVATYLRGRRVAGVQVRDDVTNVHVVLSWDALIPETADAIRAALAPLLTTSVHVTVEDLAADPRDAR